MEIITSKKNPVVLHLKRLGDEPKHRHACREFLCDGEKLLIDALKSGAEITAVMTSKPELPNLPSKTRVICAAQNLLDYVSPLKNAQNILFSCRMPREKQQDYSGLSILLDSIQDPGNVGTILRSSNAFGIERVLLTAGSADVYNPKAVRASMGAIFRQQVQEVTVPELAESGVPLIGAALAGDCIDIRELRESTAIIAIGSEGQGLSGKILELCNKFVKIPISPDCESLNASVAASIIMWELKYNQRR